MVTAYPVHSKQKCMDICTAFARGCGGEVAAGSRYRVGPAFFFGVNASNVAIWRQAVRSGQDYFYADNSYFDVSRQRYFRITKNRLQHTGLGRSDGARFRALGVSIEPWRTGETVLVCPQSVDFMTNVIGANEDWLPRTRAALAMLTDRPVKVRPWNANKGALATTLETELVNAHALVTWSSAAAVTALLAGVPAVTLGQSAAEPVSTPLLAIESPRRPEREKWAGVLADNQWTMAEITNGMAWKHLNAGL